MSASLCLTALAVLALVGFIFLDWLLGRAGVKTMPRNLTLLGFLLWAYLVVAVSMEMAKQSARLGIL